MLNVFRKAKKAYAMLITVMLLLPMQQSFAQTLDKTAFLFDLIDITTSNSNMEMTKEHCNTMVDMEFSSIESMQQNDCCEENSCDSNHCSYSSSVVALVLPDLSLVKFFDNQRYKSFTEQREYTFLPSELFRPPRQI